MIRSYCLCLNSHLFFKECLTQRKGRLISSASELPLLLVLIPSRFPFGMIFLLPEGRHLLTFLLIQIFWWWILSAFVHLDRSWFYFHFYCLLTWGSFLGSARTPSMPPPCTFSEAVTGQHGVHTVCAHPSGTTVLAWCPGPWEPVTLYFIQVLSRYRALVHLLGCPQYHSIVTLSMMFSVTNLLLSLPLFLCTNVALFSSFF